MAAGQHQRIEAAHPVKGDHAWMAIRTNQKTPRTGELRCRQLGGAVMEIGAQHLVGIIFQIAKGGEEMGMGKIAVPVGGFRAGNIGIDMDVVILCGGADKAEELGQCLARLAPCQHLVGGDDCACVHKRIAGAAAFMFQLHDGIERRARRLSSDAAPQLVARPAKRDGEGKDLGDALRRKPGGRVPGAVDLPICGRHGDGELMRVDLAQFGNVARNLAPVGIIAKVGVDGVEDLLHLRGHVCGPPSFWPTLAGWR